MRRLLKVGLMFWALRGESEPIHLEGMPYKPNVKTQIIWKAQTNELPKQFWIYKVVRQTFPNAVVSNAMAMGSFRPLDMLHPVETNLFQFQDARQNPKRYLKITPDSGRIEFYDKDAIAPMQDPIESVPTANEVEILAHDYAQIFGIDKALLRPIRGYAADRTRSKFSKDGRETDIQVEARGILLLRQIDGIPVYGNGNQGGLWIEFGNNAKVAGVDLNWANFRPSELRITSSRDNMLEEIRMGNAVLPEPRDFIHDQKLAIIKIAPFYVVAASESEPKERYGYPVACLTISSFEDRSDTNTQTFDIICPIITNKK